MALITHTTEARLTGMVNAEAVSRAAADSANLAAITAGIAAHAALNTHVSTSDRSTWNGKQDKITGDDGKVGKSALAAAVQASLDKADSALQAHQDISGKLDNPAGGSTGNVLTKTGAGVAWQPAGEPAAYLKAMAFNTGSVRFTEKDGSYHDVNHSRVGAAKYPGSVEAFAADADPSFDEVVAKLNQLINALKG